MVGESFNPDKKSYPLHADVGLVGAPGGCLVELCGPLHLRAKQALCTEVCRVSISCIGPTTGL